MPHFSDAQLKAALKSSAGILVLAADKLKVSRQAVHHRVNKSPAIQKFIHDLEEQMLDRAEAVIADAILNKDRKTTQWYLDRKGRGRGYVTRTEQTGLDGAPLPAASVNIHVHYVDAPTDEEDVV